MPKCERNRVKSWCKLNGSLLPPSITCVYVWAHLMLFNNIIALGGLKIRVFFFRISYVWKYARENHTIYSPKKSEPFTLDANHLKTMDFWFSNIFRSNNTRCCCVRTPMSVWVLVCEKWFGNIGRKFVPTRTL